MQKKRKFGLYPWRLAPEPVLLQSGEPFFNELLKQISHARFEISIQVYIFEPDETGELIIQALTSACARGVKVKILADAYGSANLIKHKHRFETSGIQIRFYSPVKVGNAFRLGMRLHHKIFVFDNQYAMLGGINISDHYSMVSNPPWLDFGLLIQGKAVTDLYKIVSSTGTGWRRLFRYKTPLPEDTNSGNGKWVSLRILQNHWFKARFAISKQYRNQIRHSQKELVLVASYFLPSLAFIRLIKKAAARGVKVTLVTGGLSDVPVVQNATRYFYGDLLDSNVRIIEWNKSVLHAKLAFSWPNWVCMGSYNLNHLSDFGSVECNVEIKDEKFYSRCLQQVMEQIQSGGQLVSKKSLKQTTGWITRLKLLASYLLVRAALNTMFFLQSRNRIGNSLP